MAVKPQFLQLFLNYFKGREDYLGVQGEDFYYPIPCILDESHLLDHINSIQTFGCYVLTKSSECNFICLDIDIPKGNLLDVEFKNSQIKFEYLEKNLKKIIHVFVTELGFSKQNILLEDTGGRGYHIWVFFESPIQGTRAVQFGRILKEKYEISCEFFPKQGHLTQKRKFGNLIKLPLGMHKAYEQRSRFFTIDHDEIIFIDSIDDNFVYLNTIDKVPISKIDSIIHDNIDIARAIQNDPQEIETIDIVRPLYKKNYPQLINNCSAYYNLQFKASSGITLNRKEAFHLTNLLLSIQDSDADLKLLLHQSYQELYSEEIANSEIEKIRPFIPTTCLTLFKEGICNNYCEKGLEKRNEDPLLKKTNPLSLWLERIETKRKFNIPVDILEAVCSIENIRLAYSRLKEYCSKQDGIFFDLFDFEFFENNFDENVQLISIGLKHRTPVPNIRFDIFKIPKKLNEDGMIEYRKMGYCSVFDQIIVQAIFNIIGPILEEQFQDFSYGYRLNVTEPKSNEIFEDWTEKYPQFRTQVLSKLREPETKYYLCCDLKGFYDNIQKATVVGQLRRFIDDEYVFSILKNVILSYSFEDKKEIGIPQGPAYARTLANLYLNDFDKEISKRARYYFRYVDDFFILFDSHEQAVETFNWVSQRLALLGLELSIDPEKQAIITSSSDEDIIVEKMDSLQYALFDQLKYLPFLDETKIKEYYTRVSHQIISSEDIKSVNKMLPSLVYIYSQELGLNDASAEALVELIDEFAKKKYLFPRKFTKLFTRIIELYLRTSKDLISFYLNLDESFKTIFLLRLYDLYLSQPLVYKDFLFQVIKDGLSSEDKYLLGFSISIYFKIRNDFDHELRISQFLDHVISENNEFLAIKFFNNVDYFDLESANKELLLGYFKPSTYYLVKKNFIHGLTDLKKFSEIDSEVFRNILNTNYFLLQVECCRMMSLFISHNSLFELVSSYLEEQPPIYKAFIVDSIGRSMFEKYKNANRFELDSIQILYSNKVDEEISSRIIEIIARIKNEFITSIPSPIDNFSQRDSYNECLYYESNENNRLNIEIIPYRKFHFASIDKYDQFRQSILNCSELKIIPKIELEYKVNFDSIFLKYELPEETILLTSQMFNWREARDCFFAIQLINNLFRKAFKFYKIFGKFPFVNLKNVRIVGSDFDVLFLKFGLVLQERYFLKHKSLDNNNSEDISHNVYLFVFDLFFKEKKDWEIFDKTPKKNISLFLWYILKRLNSRGFSVERLNYLTQEISVVGSNSEIDICNLYFSEKLRIKLYENTFKEIHWRGISVAFRGMFDEATQLFESLDFRNISYSNKLFLNKSIPPKLHYLSKELLNLNLNIPELLPKLQDKPHVKFSKLLNAFLVFTIELLSLIKVIVKRRKQLQFLDQGVNIFMYDQGQYIMTKEESESINKLAKVYNSKDDSLFNEVVRYSLKEIAIIGIFHNSNLLKIGDSYKLSPPFGFTAIEYDNFLNIFFNKISEIEAEVYSQVRRVNFSISRNFEFPSMPSEHLESIELKIIDTLFQFKNLRRKFLAKRCQKNKFIINAFGRTIRFKRFFKRDIQAADSLLKGVPLTSTSPSHSSKFSCDLVNSKPVNVVIPNERIALFLKYLRHKKSIKRWFLNLYSGKMILIADLFIFFLLFFTHTVLTYYYDNKGDSIRWSTLWVVRQTLLAPLVFFIGKIVLFDISKWRGNGKNIFDFLRYKK